MGLLEKLGGFGYDELCAWIKRMNEYASSEEGGFGFLAAIGESMAAIMPFIWMGVMLFFVFLGKKLFPYIKFVSMAIIGAALGVYYVYPAVTQSIGISALITGIVIGVLSALFYRLLYILFFPTAIFYFVFTVCYSGFGDALASMGDLRLVIYAVVAVVMVIVAFILRKYVEMLGTAVIGARVIAVNLLTMLASPEVGPSWLLPTVITLIIGGFGFFVQFKTRKRY